MLSSLRHWSQRLLAQAPLLLPASCALCGCVQEATICEGCRRQFFHLKRQRCRQCALPLPTAGSGIVCGECLRHPPSFDATVIAADYAAPVDQLVLALKFGSRIPLAALMANILRDAALQRQELPLPTQLIPVPLGSKRLSERGFNQALEIARPLSRKLGVTLAPHLLSRERETRAQSLLHPNDRHHNIRGAFIVPAKAFDLVRGAHIGVVDDVMTTGETLNEIASTLKRFGVARVTNFVFARTLPN